MIPRVDFVGFPHFESGQPTILGNQLTRALKDPRCK